MVDIEARSIEVWTPEATFPTVERERVVWQPDEAAEPLTITLSEILPPT